MKSSRYVFVASVLLSLVGIGVLAGSLLRILGHQRLPVQHLHELGHIVGTIFLPALGLTLVYLAVFVGRRRRLAVLLSLLLCALLAAYFLLVVPLGPMTVLGMVGIIAYGIVIVRSWRCYTIRHNTQNLSKYVFPITIIAGIGLVYGVVGFYFFGTVLFHDTFSLFRSIDLAVHALTGMSGSMELSTHGARLFVDSLGSIGLVVLIASLDVLFRPLRYKIVHHEADAHYRRAETIVRTTSVSSEDYFKLWPHDKQYFFSRDHAAFIAYKSIGHTVIVLGDPVGYKDSFREMIGEFTEQFRARGWRLAVVNADNQTKRRYAAYGLKAMFIGNEGVVNLSQFVTETARNKHFRYVRNKARRDGLVVEEWQDLDAEKLAVLRGVSDAWLSRNGRREYTFFMGYFDKNYLRDSRVFVLLQDGIVVAYTNVIPSFVDSHASLDQLRVSREASPVSMHFLLMQVIERLHGEHVESLNIGLAPLAGVAKSDEKFPSRAALTVVRHLGAPYYSFQGLEQFKRKFKPEWEPRTLLYDGSLIRVMQDIERAATLHGQSRWKFYIITGSGVALLVMGIYLIVS